MWESGEGSEQILLRTWYVREDPRAGLGRGAVRRARSGKGRCKYRDIAHSTQAERRLRGLGRVSGGEVWGPKRGSMENTQGVI